MQFNFSSHFMSIGKIQKHFDQHHVEYVGRGKQAVVHGTSSLVIKQHDPHPDIAHESSARFHHAYRKGQELLGGLAVPFAVLPALTMRSPRRFFGLFPSSTSVVSDPVVQERFHEDDVLSSRIFSGLLEGKHAEVRDILRSWIDVNIDAAQRGVYIGDFHFGNYIVNPDTSTVHVHDVGLSLIGDDWRNMPRDDRQLDVARSFYNARYHFNSLVRMAEGDDSGLDIVNQFHNALSAVVIDGGFESSNTDDKSVPRPQLKV